MTTRSRQQIFAKAAKKLRQDFRELSTVPHNALKGHEAERLVRRFLAEHLPKRFDVGSGLIIDHENSLSKQSDVIIYDAYNCPVYRASDNAAIIPSDNVAAVVQVKSRLDKARLSDAFENIASVKSLAKSEMPDLHGRIQTVGCVFAFKSSLTMETLASHYVEEVRSRGLGHHIDLILVLDRGIITLAMKPPGDDWGAVILDTLGGPKHVGVQFAAAIHEMGKYSLDAFLRHLLLPLMNFRSLVAHPGFDWNPPYLESLQFIGSFSKQTDPQRRAKPQKKSMPRR
jgi:hypothetical protein